MIIISHNTGIWSFVFNCFELLNLTSILNSQEFISPLQINDILVHNLGFALCPARHSCHSHHFLNSVCFLAAQKKMKQIYDNHLVPLENL